MGTRLWGSITLGICLALEGSGAGGPEVRILRFEPEANVCRAGRPETVHAVIRNTGGAAASGVLRLGVTEGVTVSGTQTSGELALAPGAAAAGEHRVFVEGWPTLKAALAAWLAARERTAVPEAVLAAIAALPSADYLSAVQGLPTDVAQTLAGWLEQTVSAASEPCHRCW